MQLVTLDSREVAGRPGVILPGSGQILDLVAAPGTESESRWLPRSVVSILAAGEDGRERVARLLESAADPSRAATMRASGALLPRDGTRLLTPIRRPALVLVAGEVTAGNEPAPVGIVRSPHTVDGPGAAVSRPRAAARGLARGLATVVIGRPVHRVEPEAAARAIAAVTLMLSFSGPLPAAPGAPDWRAFVDSLQFPGACPVGPALVTVDELRPAMLPLGLSVNGVAVADGTVDLDAAATCVAALSQRYAFRPGDLVGLGPGLVLGDGGRPPAAGDRVALTLGDHMQLDAVVTT